MYLFVFNFLQYLSARSFTWPISLSHSPLGPLRRAPAEYGSRGNRNQRTITGNGTWKITNNRYHIIQGLFSDIVNPFVSVRISFVSLKLFRHVK